jgi:Conserved TM helix
MYRNDAEVAYWQTQAQEWGPRILGAIAILIIAYVLARAAKWAIAKVVDRVPALRKHYEAEPGKTLGSLIGDVVFWLIILIGIMLALQPLRLSHVLEPVRQLTTNTFAFVPNILGAGLLLFIGVVIAKIVRRVVEGTLLAANADGWLRRTGFVENAGTLPAAPAAGPVTVSARPSISRSVGMIVYVLILIPFVIGALDTLQIEAISGPATLMLRTILESIPNILGALILLAIGFFLGRLAKQFIEQLLPSAGFDRAMGALGFSPETTTPSRTVGTIVMVAILIFFAIKAAELLQSPIIAVMLAQVLELGSRVLFGTGIILGGVIIARILSNLISGADSEGWLPSILKWSIIALAVAMGLRFMGLANEIVIIAFASIIGSAAIACALAFGLGGRPTAHKLLEQWTADNRIPPPPTRPQAPVPPTGGDPATRI